MSSYQEKQAARKARFEELADKARTESSATYDRARSMGAAIPFGQPILVGHHSEGRDRSYRSKIRSTYSKAFDLQDKAKHYEQKAKAVGRGGVSSDDPEAIDKLLKKVAYMEEVQEHMKAVNKVIRLNKTPESRKAALMAMGADMTEEYVDSLLKPNFAGDIGKPPYMLSNNNANIRRLKERIAELEKSRQRASVEEVGQGYTYREDTDENRAMFVFDGKPSEAIRTILKSEAFKWSPSRGAWVRQLTESARGAAARARAEIERL